jgi:hypothetical protein
MADVETVRRLALALPEVEEGTSYRTTAWKVRKKMFARVKEDGESIVLFVDFLEREALTQERPDTYVVTDHYRDYPMVIVRLATVDLDELRELLIESWRRVAPKRLLAEFDARNPVG